ncbi:MAG: NIPSNAP family protein, partial [Bacteroidota bacterium]
YTFPGKLGALHQRFQDHTLEIFENNGIHNIAYFNLDQEDPLAKNVLMYFVTFPDTTARKESWASFSADPAWKSAYANSIEAGKIVDSLTAELMMPTRFSPLK